MSVIKQPHGGAMNRFEKGKSGNPKGRPKKIRNLLKGEGYSLSQINEVMCAMIAIDVDKMKKIFADPKASVLEKTIISACLTSIRKGNLDSMETLLNRIYGKPKETVQHNDTAAIMSTLENALDPVAASKRYQEIMGA